MGISHYLREIGRGKEGARALSRAQASDLMGQVLDGDVTELEVGAFCLAMRIKGETAQEMAGFLDATEQRLARLPAGPSPLVVLPSYNGARKLPLLTPLLGLLLSRQGLAVLIHGTSTEDARVPVQQVLAALDVKPLAQVRAVAPGELAFAPTGLLCPALERLLAVRRVVGLRNPSHSLVKQMNPSQERAFIVASHTHPEYAVSMAAVFAEMKSSGMLLRGTEGEPVADPRRTPAMQCYVDGVVCDSLAAQAGTLGHVPQLPQTTDAGSAARYSRAVLHGELPIPAPLALQVERVVQGVASMQRGTA